MLETNATNLFQELYCKLKAFVENEDHLPMVMTFVTFVGCGQEYGNKCYFETKPTSANSRPFEIWTNCMKIFANRKSWRLAGKPKILFVQLRSGMVTIHNSCSLSHIVQAIYDKCVPNLEQIATKMK